MMIYADGRCNFIITITHWYGANRMDSPTLTESLRWAGKGIAMSRELWSAWGTGNVVMAQATANQA